MGDMLTPRLAAYVKAQRQLAQKKARESIDDLGRYDDVDPAKFDVNIDGNSALNQSLVEQGDVVMNTIQTKERERKVIAASLIGQVLSQSYPPISPLNDC